jgi:hypothetical protein
MVVMVVILARRRVEDLCQTVQHLRPINASPSSNRVVSRTSSKVWIIGGNVGIIVSECGVLEDSTFGIYKSKLV